MKKISEAQKKILLYLYKTYHRQNSGVPATIIGETVGEALKTNQNTHTRKAAWASPKCKSLQHHGFVEQCSDRTYRITANGVRHVNSNLLNGYEGMGVIELLTEFEKEVRSENEETKLPAKESGNWITKIIGWIVRIFK